MAADACILVPECCRCCLTEENDMVYVFDILDEFDSKICDLIETCGGIEITEEDCYSKNICGNCLNDLANAARFRDRCAKTEQVLHNTSVMVGDEPEEQEDVVFEQAEESLDTSALIKLEAEDLIDYSDDEQDEELPIDFIVAEEPNDPELDAFDYDQLISSQNSDLQDDYDEIPPTVATGVDSRTILKVRDKGMEKTARPRPLQLNFVCQKCGAGFALQKNLAKHMASHQNFVCEVCLMPFDSDSDLQAHKAQGHDEASDDQAADESKLLKKKHPCTFCGKGFVSNSALTAHVRVHTKERPYPCSYCPKRFRTVGAQELHERRHSGIKPYKCDLCGRGFAESSNLKVHRQTHTKEKPHVCTVCNRAFARVFLLKIHQRTHTGERPFPCQDCGKLFSQQGDLAAHRRIHTGERPHKCDICGRGFIKSSGLVQHRKKHERQLMGGIRTLGSLANVDDLIVGEYEEGCDSGEQPEDGGDSVDETMFETIIV